MRTTISKRNAAQSSLALGRCQQRNSFLINVVRGNMAGAIRGEPAGFRNQPNVRTPSSAPDAWCPYPFQIGAAADVIWKQREIPRKFRFPLFESDLSRHK